MDWIEQWFGFAPDNGDGSLEFLVTLTAVATLTCILVFWRIPGAYAAVSRWLAPLRPGVRSDDRG